MERYLEMLQVSRIGANFSFLSRMWKVQPTGTGFWLIFPFATKKAIMHYQWLGINTSVND